jgi:hypothetical protein
LLHYRAIESVPSPKWNDVRLRDVAVPLGGCLALGPDDALADALMELAATPLRRALVLEAGRVEGLLRSPTCRGCSN